jgi:hypothetical protein
MASRKPKKHRPGRDRLSRRLSKRLRGAAYSPAVRNPAVPPGARVVYQPAGHEKMSEVLEDFVEPYRELADTEDAFRELLTLGIVAWNAALLPEDGWQAMTDEMFDAGFSHAPRADRARARELVELLVRRKLEHFAANQRAIISFELTDTGDSFHLSVISTL